ncbi:MAG: cation:proton antiporter [Candidatus Omnitrophota bacterium]
MKIVKYFLGAIAIIIIVVFIFSLPVSEFLYQDSLFTQFFKRGLFVIFLSAFLCLWRIMRGPTASDRIVAIDMLGILIIGICCFLSIVTGRGWYIDIGIAWALQSFISTLALAKFLEGRNFDD